MKTVSTAITKPLPCVILGVDAGKEWGAAIFSEDELYGKACSADMEIEELVSCAYDLAVARSLRLVICAEKWAPFGQRMTAKTVAGLNERFGRWLEEIERLPPRKPTTKIVRFYPQTWRSRVLGGSAENSAAWKQRAVAYVKARWHIDVDHNTAEAICIAYCGSLAPEVAAVLGKRELK